MTESPRSPSEDESPKVDEADFAQRPEEESQRGRTAKIVWVIVLIAIGVVAIPVIFIGFSALVQECGGQDVEKEGEPVEQQTAPESDDE
ncbi:MAG: hypothetical protein ACOCV2_00985 [Persicimonas sp.]